MTSFTCLIEHAPHQGQHSYSALQFCQAAIAQGHQVQQVFFYGDAVSHGHAHVDMPSDEVNMQQRWQAFAQEHAVPLVVCATVASRQGVADGVSLAPGFLASGLTDYMEAVANSDRLVQF